MMVDMLYINKNINGGSWCCKYLRKFQNIKLQKMNLDFKNLFETHISAYPSIQIKRTLNYQVESSTANGCIMEKLIETFTLFHLDP